MKNYVLIDPRNNKRFYHSATSLPLKKQLVVHLKQASSGSYGIDYIDTIKDILGSGYIPEISETTLDEFDAKDLIYTIRKEIIDKELEESVKEFKIAKEKQTSNRTKKTK